MPLEGQPRRWPARQHRRLGSANVAVNAAPPQQPAASAPQKPAEQTETSPPTSPPEEEPDFDDIAAQDAFAQDLAAQPPPEQDIPDDFAAEMTTGRRLAAVSVAQR